MTIQPKVKSIAATLSERYGGKWEYVAPARWECDDGKRYVHRVAVGFDHTGEYTGESAMCLYYTDGRASEWVVA